MKFKVALKCSSDALSCKYCKYLSTPESTGSIVAATAEVAYPNGPRVMNVFLETRKHAFTLANSHQPHHYFTINSRICDHGRCIQCKIISWKEKRNESIEIGHFRIFSSSPNPFCPAFGEGDVVCPCSGFEGLWRQGYEIKINRCLAIAKLMKGTFAFGTTPTTQPNT